MACLAMLTANAEDYKLSFGALSVNSDNYTQLNELLTAVFRTLISVWYNI